MNNNRIPFIIIGIGIFTAEIILMRGSDMGVAEWVAIGIALLGIAGGIWGQIVQFNKDAQRIDGVNQTVHSIKDDTIKMEPSIARIEDNTNAMKDKMLETILPGIKTINKMEDDLDVLVRKAEYEEKLRKDVTNVVMDPAIIKSAVDVIYEENTKLNKQVAILNSQNIILQNENNRLQKEIAYLKNMVQEYSMDLGEEIQGGMEI